MQLWRGECEAMVSGGLLFLACQADTKEDALGKMQAKARTWCPAPNEVDVQDMRAQRVDGDTTCFSL